MAIFIPKRINVGYQNRDDTYTGKLAYIIYYDEKGKLRKEKSWNGWRDEKIPNTEFDNIPTEGFVLNKSAGGVEHSYGWDTRKSYCRVYDPRGFEFEIGIENLLYILEYCTSMPGKGINGEFVYGWDKTELILIPVASPDYKKCMEYTNTLNEKKSIKVKDLMVGATYLGKDNCEYVYMGKFDQYSQYLYRYKDKTFITRKKLEKWCEEHNEQFTMLYGQRKYDYESDVTGIIGHNYCFFKRNEKEWKEFCWFSSIGNKFIDCIQEECCSDYADLYYKLEGKPKFSPIDRTKDRYFPMSYDEFYDLLKNKYQEDSFVSARIFVKRDNEIQRIYLDPCLYTNKYRLRYCKGAYGVGKEMLDIFPTENNHMIPVTIKEIYDKLHPLYLQTYLANGREYRRKYKYE